MRPLSQSSLVLVTCAACLTAVVPGTLAQGISARGNLAGIGQGRAAMPRQFTPPAVQRFQPTMPAVQRSPVRTTTPRACAPYSDYSTGSGLTVRGFYSDDHWKVGFRVGSAVGAGIETGCAPTHPIADACNLPCYPATGYPIGYPIGYWPWYGYGWYGNDGWYDSATRYNSPSVFGATAATDPRLLGADQQPQAEAPEPPKPLDVALFLMFDEKPDEAVDWFRKHLDENPDDAGAMRSLAVALLDSKKPDDASAVMRLAYRTQPDLASDAIDLEALSLSEREARVLVTKAVTFGHQAKSASGWLLASVLMQAEGRKEPALNVLKRAEAQGLETEVVTLLKAELK